MPAHGDQHRATAAAANPFEDQTTRISEYTAQEVATLQSRLDKQLGPEYISTRPGAGGGKVHYLAAEKLINLANEVFGFNGWSSQIQNVQIDFVDDVQGKTSLGLSIVVRVTLRDGTYHEDIGYGHIENCKGKAAAFEKAKKEAATDALKRALRNFGNILGNCLYDKDYLSRVTKLKIAPAKWDSERLHRHRDFVIARTDPETQNEDEPQTPATFARTSTSASKDMLDDEFGDNLFDGVEMPVAEARPDEVVLYDNQPEKPAIPRTVAPPQQRRPQPPAPSRPAPAANFNKHNAPQQPSGPLPRTHGGYQNTNTPPSVADTSKEITNNQNHNHRPHEPPVGFYTGKAAEILLAQENGSASLDVPLPKFKPDQESPSIRRSEGINHQKSAPVLRANVENVSSATPAKSAEARPATAARSTTKTNFVDPASDSSRRIGMPAAPSPHANRSAYRPPGPAVTAAGVKRDFSAHAANSTTAPTSNGSNSLSASSTRPALADLSNTSNNAPNNPEATVKPEPRADDTKRPRLES